MCDQLLIKEINRLISKVISNIYSLEIVPIVLYIKIVKFLNIYFIEKN